MNARITGLLLNYDEVVKIAIIGSGPSAAAALEQARGINETEIYLIDTGLIESEGQALSENERKNVTKSYLGSDHPYRRFEYASHIEQNRTYIPRSFAFGGLSLVWGATMLPFLNEDCEEWLVTPQQLEPFYRRVSSYVWVSGGDRLSSKLIYPDYGKIGTLESSSRYQRLIANRSSAHLGACPSRVAIRTSGLIGGCILCGQCLQGCQYGHIWNSAAFIAGMNQNEFFKVRAYVDRLFTSGRKVDISIKSHSGAVSILEGFDKVFIGAGVVETFRILSKSKMVSPTQQLSDSSISYIPFFSIFPFSKVNDNSHALTKMVFRLKHDLPGRSAHLQLYDIASDVESEIIQKFPMLRLLPSRVRKYLFTFFSIGILYLPSELSPKIEIKLKENGDVACSLSENQTSDSQRLRYMRRIVRQNTFKFLRIGILPLNLAMVPKEAGSGVHTGSSFPMGASTDNLGRLHNVPNIHILDASTLPDIPAGPITFSIMANASRICSEVLR